MFPIQFYHQVQWLLREQCAHGTGFYCSISSRNCSCKMGYECGYSHGMAAVHSSTRDYKCPSCSISGNYTIWFCGQVSNVIVGWCTNCGFKKTGAEAKRCLACKGTGTIVTPCVHGCTVNESHCRHGFTTRHG